MPSFLLVIIIKQLNLICFLIKVDIPLLATYFCLLSVTIINVANIQIKNSQIYIFNYSVDEIENSGITMGSMFEEMEREHH
jgi:hypothetical protein